MNIPDNYDDQPRVKSEVTADLIRDQLLQHVKDFKTSWLKLGQALYPVYKDKFYFAWGFDKFEYYVDRELGIKKSTALKLLKTYFFLEQDEPSYLNKDFKDQRDAAQVPGCDEVNILRLARQKKELTKDDYRELRKSVFDKGKDAASVRKDLVSLMKERKPVDPDEERHKRNQVALRKMLNAISSFNKDMEALKLAPAEVLEEAKSLMSRLQEEID